MNARRTLKRGFTLVELMIVVAIIGILAALAIFGVKKYMANAKTAEARNALGRMAKDASAAFDREGMAGTVLALTKSTAVINRLCDKVEKAQYVPADTTNIKGKKYQSSPAEWNTGSSWQGWQCLHFSMDGAQYYQYGYVSSGTNGADGDTFQALAHGDLNGDSVLSTFELDGKIQKGASGGLVVNIAPNFIATNPDE